MAEERVIYIVIDPTKARSGASSVVRSLRSIETATGQVNRKLGDSQKAIQSFSRNFSRMQALLISAQPVRFLSGFIKQLIEADKVVTTFKSQMFTVTNDLEKAGESFEYLKDTAQAYAVPLNSITKGYAKLKASMDFDHLRAYNEELFQSTVILSSVLHMPEYNTERVFNVMIQIMSKGQLMMEELKQQLGEHVPGAITLAAEAMGYTVSEMMDKMQKGLISAEEFASQWSGFIIERFGPAVELSTKSIQASINRFKNVITESMIEMSQNEAGFAIAKLITAIVQKIDSASDYFAIFGEQVAGVALDMYDFVESIQPEDIERFFNAVITVTQAFIDFAAWIGRTIVFLAEHRNEVEATAGVVFGSIAAYKLYNAQQAIMVAQAKTASKAVKGLGLAVAGVTAALSLGAAAFVGYSIGSWLYDEYDVVKKVGNRIALALTYTATKVMQIFEEMGLRIKLAFNKPFEYAKNKIAQFLRFLDGLGKGVLDFFNIDIDTSNNLLSGLADNLESDEIQTELDNLEKVHRDKLESIKGIYDDLYDAIGKSDGETAESIEERLGLGKDQFEAYKKMRKELQEAARSDKEFISTLGGDGEGDSSSVEEFANHWKYARSEAEQALDSIKAKIDPVYQDMMDFSDMVADIQMAVHLGIIGEEEADKLINKLTMLGEKGDEAGETVQTRWQKVGGAMGEFAGMAQETVGHLQDTQEQGSESYKKMAVAMQALNVVQAIGAVLNQGMGDPYTAIPRMAAMAAAVASLGVSIGSLGSGGQSISESRQETQGTGSVLGDPMAKSESIANATDIIAETNEKLVNINTGMLRALERVQAGIGGASTLIARNGIGDVGPLGQGGGVLGLRNFEDEILTMTGVKPLQKIMGEIGDGLGFNFDPLANMLLGWVSGAFGSIVGGDRDVKDRGVQIIAGSLQDAIDGSLIRAYATIEEDGGWFGSDKKWDEFQNLPKQTAKQFSLVFSSIKDSVVAGAEVLGVLPNDIQARLDQFVIETQKISLKGLDAEEKEEEIAAVFGTIFDDLADAVVPFLAELQRAGEGMGETLARASTQVAVMREAIISLGLTAERENARYEAHAANFMAELMGGLENFTNAITEFEGNFLSEEEQFKNNSRRLAEAMGDLPLPETREGFAELVAIQNRHTYAGRDNIATLLRLQDAADEYYTYLEDRNDELLSNAMNELQKAVDAEKEAAKKVMEARLEANQLAIDAAREGLQAIKEEMNAIESAASGMRNSYDPIQDIRRFDALQTIQDALRTKDLTGTGEAAEIASQIDDSQYETRVAYEREQGKTLNILEELEREGGRQLTTAEKSLQSLQKQTEMIREQYNSEIARLDAIIAREQAQIDAINGVNSSVMTVREAISNLSSIMSSLNSSISASNTSRAEQGRQSMLDRAYENVLGRDVDPEGRAFWSDALNKGYVTPSALEDEIRKAATANGEISGYANGGLHDGGLRMVGERGAEIEMTGPSKVVSHEDLMNALSSGSKTSAEIRSLREDLKAANRAIVKSNEKQRELLQRWDQTGMPEARNFV